MPFLYKKKIRTTLNNKRKRVAGSEINEIGQELSINEIESNLVNNVIPMPKEFGES